MTAVKLVHTVCVYFLFYDIVLVILFFFDDSAPTEIYTLSLHDALPIFFQAPGHPSGWQGYMLFSHGSRVRPPARSEEHTSELQSRPHLVCRLLLEKKKIFFLPANC